MQNLQLADMVRGPNLPMTVVLTRQQVELVASLVEIALCRGDLADKAPMMRDILAVMEQEYLRRIGGSCQGGQR